jgi:hypothetical protein
MAAGLMMEIGGKFFRSTDPQAGMGSLLPYASHCSSYKELWDSVVQQRGAGPDANAGAGLRCVQGANSGNNAEKLRCLD